MQKWGPQRLTPSQIVGSSEGQVQAALDWQGRSIYNGDVGKVAWERAWLLWHPDVGNTEGSMGRGQEAGLRASTAVLTRVLVCLTIAGRLRVWS